MSSNHSRAPHLPHLQTQLLPSVIRQHHPFSAAPDQETAQDSNADIELLSYRESVTEDNKDKVKDCDNQNCVQQMTDLEIENESLIAMNVSLQNTVRNQARNVVQMRREINSLKRKSCDSEMLDNSESPNTEEPDLDIISPQLHNSYRLSVLSANSINVSVDETFVESVEAHHKSEQQYNVLCSTISQLIEEGQRALNETPIAETDSNSTTPQVSHNSMQFARTVSSIFEPHKNLPDSGRNSERKEQHVEHEPRNHNASSAYFIPHKSDQEHRQLLLTRVNNTDGFDILQQKTERLIETRRILTARNRRRITSASFHNNDENALYFPGNQDNGDTIQIPITLYNTFIEFVNDAQEDFETRYLKNLGLNDGDGGVEGGYGGGNSSVRNSISEKRRNTHGRGNSGSSNGVFFANYFARTGFFGWFMNIIQIRRTLLLSNEYGARNYPSDDFLQTGISNFDQTMDSYGSFTESTAPRPPQSLPSSVPISPPPLHANAGLPASNTLGTAAVKIMQEYHVDNFLAEFCFRVFVTKMMNLFEVYIF